MTNAKISAYLFFFILILIAATSSSGAPSCENYGGFDHGALVWESPDIGGGFPVYLVENTTGGFHAGTATDIHWGDAAGVTLSVLHVPGIIRAMAGDGTDYLYCLTDGAGLRVLDISIPTAPTAVTELAMADNLVGADLAGNLLGIVGDSVGLVLVDVSPPFPVSVIGSSTAVLTGADLVIIGDKVYVADSVYGLRVFDITVPAAPVLIASVPVAGHPYSIVELAPDFVLMGTSDGDLLTFDVTDPLYPELADRHPTGTDPTIRVADGVALVVGCRTRTLGYDVSDPFDIRLEFALPLYTVSTVETGIIRSGTDIYLGSPNVKKHSLGSNMQSPALIAEFTPGCKTISGLIEGPLGFITDADDNLHIIDVSDPSHPVERSVTGDYGIPLATGIAGGTVLATATPSYGSIMLTDISDPAHPVLLSEMPALLPAFDAALVGDVLYTCGIADGMAAIDVSDPAEPVVLSTVPRMFSTRIAVAGDYAYLGGGQEPAAIVDVSDPAAASIIGTVPNAPETGGVFTTGDQLFVTVPEGERIYDISTPSSPVELSTLDTWATPELALGSHIVCTSYNGLETWDLSDPFNPILTGSSPLPLVVAMAQLDDQWLIIDAYHDFMVLDPDCVTAGISSVNREVPASNVRITGACPNPFNPRVRIEFVLGERQQVSIEIFTLAGAHLRTLQVADMAPGAHSVLWDGLDKQGLPAASGVYFVRINGVAGDTATTKIALVR